MDSKENKDLNSENGAEAGIEKGNDLSPSNESQTAVNEGQTQEQTANEGIKPFRRQKRESIKEKVIDYAKYIALGTVLILAVRPFFYYPLDVFENFHDMKFNFKVAGYHSAQKRLSFSDKLSVMSKKTSRSSYKLRNKFFDKYLKIKQDSDAGLYNPIGLFGSINSDFEVLASLNKNTNDAEYLKYKERYTEEVKSLLSEYKQRSRKYKNFMNQKADLKYKIPERLSLYEDLAEAFIKYEKLPVTAESVEKLKKIAETYDEIYQQEKGMKNENTVLDFVTSAKQEEDKNKEQNSGSGNPMYGGSPESSGFYDGMGMGSMYGGGMSRSRASYPTFAYMYKTAYIVTEGVLYMTRMCDNAQTIKQYIEPLEIRDILPKKEVDKITAMCRDRIPEEKKSDKAE